MKYFAVFLFLVVVPQLVFAQGVRKQGREGNEYFRQDRYGDAQEAYSEGLARLSTEREDDKIYYGLQHNLGASLHRQEDYEGAQEAFARALEHAPSEAEVSRVAYNAGNNAFRQQETEAALAHYRRALLANPDNEDAKFNYEFVKRQLQQQQQQQDQNQEQQQDQNEQQEENNQEQNQEQDQQQQQNNQQDQQQHEQGEQQPQQQPQELSREQTERILQALENEEEELLREVQKVKGRPRRVTKDW